MIDKILSNLQAEADFFGGEPMGSLQKMFYCKGVEKAIEIVQEVAKEYDWVSVKERLPEPFQRVLVYDAWDDSMTIEHLQENDSFIDSVVAWMPLPIAPYQKGE